MYTLYYIIGCIILNQRYSKRKNLTQHHFVVKNHPFSDGNKRSSAFLFVDFLYRIGRLLDAAGHAIINDTGLAALTLLIAESDPKQKEILIRWVIHMLAGKE